MTERPHAEYSPSRLPYLDACPGWLGDGAPGPLAERGTRIGDRLARYIVEGADPLYWADEDDKAALAYGMSTLDAISAKTEGLDWWAEKFVDSGIADCGGYTDLLCVDDILGHAILAEIKTGRGQRAPAGGNLQVMGYVLGLFNDNQGIESVEAYLVECDRETTSTERFVRDDIPMLRHAVKSVIVSAQHATEADLKSGSHCGYCKRREQCPRLAEAPGHALALIDGRALSAADYASAMSPETLGETLSRVAPMADIVETYVGALKARAMALLEAGAEVPGWRVKTMGGQRTWTDAEGAATALSAAGYEVPAEIPSPAQVEKRLGKEAGAIIGPFVSKGTRKKLEAS